VPEGSIRNLTPLYEQPNTPTEDVVEKVARAVAPHIFYRFDCDTIERANDWDCHDERDKETMRMIARAAIEALP
jgi:hypothetical protein